MSKPHSKGENIVVTGYWQDLHQFANSEDNVYFFREHSRILGVRKTMKGAKALAYRKRFRLKDVKYISFSYLHFK